MDGGVNLVCGDFGRFAVQSGGNGQLVVDGPDVLHGRRDAQQQRSLGLLRQLALHQAALEKHSARRSFKHGKGHSTSNNLVISYLASRLQCLVSNVKLVLIRLFLTGPQSCMRKFIYFKLIMCCKGG